MLCNRGLPSFAASRSGDGDPLAFLDLPVADLDGLGATENGDGHPEFSCFGIDFLDHAILTFERAIGDADGIAHLELNFGFHRAFLLGDLGEHAIDLTLAHGHRLVLGAGELDHAGCFLDEIPGAVDHAIVLFEEVHVYDDVAGIDLAVGLHLFPAADFGDALGGDKDLEDQFAHLFGDHAALDILTHFILLAGEDVDSEPLVVGCRDSHGRKGKGKGGKVGGEDASP